MLRTERRICRCCETDGFPGCSGTGTGCEIPWVLPVSISVDSASCPNASPSSWSGNAYLCNKDPVVGSYLWSTICPTNPCREGYEGYPFACCTELGPGSGDTCCMGASLSVTCGDGVQLHENAVYCPEGDYTIRTGVSLSPNGCNCGAGGEGCFIGNNIFGFPALAILSHSCCPFSVTAISSLTCTGRAIPLGWRCCGTTSTDGHFPTVTWSIG
jgi:hypothetical protein